MLVDHEPNAAPCVLVSSIPTPRTRVLVSSCPRPRVLVPVRGAVESGEVRSVCGMPCEEKTGAHALARGQARPATPPDPTETEH